MVMTVGLPSGRRPGGRTPGQASVAPALVRCGVVILELPCAVPCFFTFSLVVVVDSAARRHDGWASGR